MTTTTTVNPTTGEDLVTYQYHTDTEVDQIVDAAHAAFDTWRRRPLKDRIDIVREIGSLLRERSSDLARLMTDEMGKVIAHGAREVQLCAHICDWTADHAAEELADEARPFDGGRAIVSYRPVGIIFGIQPFNFPAYQAIRFSIPQLVAGNAVLLKHARSVWGSALFLEQLYHDAGVPNDLFRVVKISNEQSSALIANPQVRGITLTGSGGRIFNNGETCVAAKRFVVVDAIYDTFVDAFVAQLQTVKMGDPNDKATGLGPMARQDLRDDLHEQVRSSIDAGAKLTMGGEIPDRPGFFYPVTVLENVRPGMPAYDDELFGPVASIIRVANDNEAMRVANPQLPFGGVKESGYGREHGGFGLKEFVNVKSIQVTEVSP